MLDDVQAEPIEKLRVVEEWVTVPAEVGDVSVRIVRPPLAHGTLPVSLVAPEPDPALLAAEPDDIHLVYLL